MAGVEDDPPDFQPQGASQRGLAAANRLRRLNFLDDRLWRRFGCFGGLGTGWWSRLRGNYSRFRSLTRRGTSRRLSRFVFLRNGHCLRRSGDLTGTPGNVYNQPVGIRQLKDRIIIASGYIQNDSCHARAVQARSYALDQLRFHRKGFSGNAGSAPGFVKIHVNPRRIVHPAHFVIYFLLDVNHHAGRSRRCPMANIGDLRQAQGALRSNLRRRRFRGRSNGYSRLVRGRCRLLGPGFQLLANFGNGLPCLCGLPGAGICLQVLLVMLQPLLRTAQVSPIDARDG